MQASQSDFDLHQRLAAGSLATRALCSTSDLGFAGEDMWGAGQELQRYRSDRQLLMRSDGEIAMRCEPVDKARQDLPLKSLRKIGERDITTEDEIEEAVQRFLPEGPDAEIRALHGSAA